MPHRRLGKISTAKIRETMGVIIDDSSAKTAVDRVKQPFAVVKEVTPMVGIDEKERIVAKMAIAPAPRKSGGLDMGDQKPASDGRTIGPPDAKVTSGKMGVGGAILIGVAVLTIIMILGGRRA